MPVQKGKRHKKPRRRGPANREISPASFAQPVAPPPARRGWLGRRRQPPLAVNLALGIGMLALGFVFFFSMQGTSQTERIIFLALYIVLGGTYLFNAWRQIRSRLGS